MKVWAIIDPDGLVSRTDSGYFMILPDEYGLDEDRVLGRVFILPVRRKRQGYRAKLVTLELPEEKNRD